jgi:ribosomal protein S10
VLPTRHETWVVVNRDDGTIVEETMDKWEADDLKRCLEIQDEEWDWVDGYEEDYDWEE